MFRLSTSALLPLKNMRFVLSGKMNKEKYQGKIEALGGKVKNTVDKDTLALISDKGKIIQYYFYCLLLGKKKQFNKGRGKGNNGISKSPDPPTNPLNEKRKNMKMNK